MQQVVQDAMMSISPLGGEGALEARGEDEGGGGSVGGEGQGHGQEGGEGEGDVGGLLERSVSRDQREEEWALRLAESEDAMVRRMAFRFAWCAFAWVSWFYLRLVWLSLIPFCP